MRFGSSMIEILRDFVTKMNALEIEYMLTGSFAMSAYGEIRMTRDIDVVIQLAEKNITPLFALFRDDYYVSEDSIRRALEMRSMFNVISLDHAGKVDCIIQKDTDFARSSFERRYKVAVSGVEFWTITKEDLIISKMAWARETYSEMQIRDIANLTSSEYDSEYVDEWIERLKLQVVWSTVEKWKTQRENHGS